MTFSIAARCPRTGMFGIAIASSSPAVAARCAHARAGVGVVASQNITDPRLGSQGLDLLAAGTSAQDALFRLRTSAPHIDYRQLAIVDRNGQTAAFSGTHVLGKHGAAEGTAVVAAGNMLRSESIPRRMVDAFEAAEADDLCARLLGGMRAALREGGEEGPVHSAGMLLVRDVPWPVADLRVDWRDADPIDALAELWEIWRPQMDAYVTRALDPSAAPSFGVPGSR